MYCSRTVQHLVGDSPDLTGIIWRNAMDEIDIKMTSITCPQRVCEQVVDAPEIICIPSWMTGATGHLLYAIPFISIFIA